ncbi:divisome protein SepX/GlpR [Plantactinospora sp. CA-290183]|uniref:divisome protein SepX/GlpR n=1 Tax=Plantactinospora sp. CA-290183 TaxID=3240006 RepID=UPI003D8E5FE2
MRVPASVLLAVLAAAGLLALAPALVRRYDASERLAAERAQSTARVLQRRRRHRTVPGRKPVNPPRSLVVTLSVDASTGEPAGSAPPARTRRSRRLRSVPRDAGRSRRRPPPRRHTPAVYRRRRVFAALLLLNLVELVGVIVVSPGFWIGFSVTCMMLVVYVVHLRSRAIGDRRRRRAQAREAAWLAARQAEVRREQARRAQARRETQRRLAAQRELVRRAALGLDRIADLPPAASGGGRAAGSVSYRRAGGLRGRPYEAGRGPTAGQ